MSGSVVDAIESGVSYQRDLSENCREGCHKMLGNILKFIVFLLEEQVGQKGLLVQ